MGEPSAKYGNVSHSLTFTYELTGELFIFSDMEILLGLSNKMVKAAEMNFGPWSKEYASLFEKEQKLMNLRT